MAWMFYLTIIGISLIQTVSVFASGEKWGYEEDTQTSFDNTIIFYQAAKNGRTHDIQAMIIQPWNDDDIRINACRIARAHKHEELASLIESYISPHALKKAPSLEEMSQTQVWDQISAICSVPQGKILPEEVLLEKLRRMIIIASSEVLEQKRRKIVNGFLTLIRYAKKESFREDVRRLDFIFQSLERSILVLQEAQDPQADQIERITSLLLQYETILNEKQLILNPAQERGFLKRIQNMLESFGLSRDFNSSTACASASEECGKMSHQDFIDEQFKEAMHSDQPFEHLREMLEKNDIPDVMLMAQYIAQSDQHQEFLTMIEAINAELYEHLLSLIFS